METKSWKTIKAGSKITLATDTKFNTLSGKKIIPAGHYFINGFWLNVCGIGKKYTGGLNDYVFSSPDLKKFENIN